MSCGGRRSVKLDENPLCNLGTDSDANITNLTDQAVLLADQSHRLVFAKTHLAKANRKLRIRINLFDARRGPRLHFAQGTKLRFGTLTWDVAM